MSGLKRKALGDNDRDVRQRTDEGASKSDSAAETHKRPAEPDSEAGERKVRQRITINDEYAYECDNIKDDMNNFVVDDEEDGEKITDAQRVVVSGRGEKFLMNWSACQYSQLIITFWPYPDAAKHFKQVAQELPLPGIEEEGLMELICQFLKARYEDRVHWVSKTIEEQIGPDVSRVLPKPIPPSWYVNNIFGDWVKSIQPPMMLVHLISAADYLDIKDLCNLCAVEIGRRATQNELTPGEMDDMFGRVQEPAGETKN